MWQRGMVLALSCFFFQVNQCSWVSDDLDFFLSDLVTGELARLDDEVGVEVVEVVVVFLILVRSGD